MKSVYVIKGSGNTPMIMDVFDKKQRPLADIARDLDGHHADMFHIDCDDNPELFKDIEDIRQLSSTPVVLYI